MIIDTIKRVQYGVDLAEDLVMTISQLFSNSRRYNIFIFSQFIITFIIIIIIMNKIIILFY